MSFAEEVRAFAKVATASAQLVTARVAEHVRQSIVEGSPVTGAPGQPVGQGPHAGKLRDSWELSHPAPDVYEVTSSLDYAADVEDNVHGFAFHNHGPHSVKLTLDGGQAIVDHEAEQVGR